MGLIAGGKYIPSRQQVEWMDRCLLFLKGGSKRLDILSPRRRGKTVFLCKLALYNLLEDCDVVILANSMKTCRIIDAYICQLNFGNIPSAVKITEYSQYANSEFQSKKKRVLLLDEESHSKYARYFDSRLGKDEKLISIGTLWC